MVCLGWQLAVVFRFDQFGQRVGKTMQPFLELRTLQGKQNVEQVLRCVGVACREVGLKQVQSGCGTVPLGIVARGDEFNDGFDMSG